MNTNDWLPIIHTTRCTGCGVCIAQCPTHALGRRAGKAVLVHPQFCTYCADCETLCPVGAIEVPYLISTLPSANPRKDTL